MSSLFIVESPNKIKKIKGFLGNQYNVQASVGHIRDLNPKSLGISIENNFEPCYEVLQDKKKVVAGLRKAYKNCKVVYLATDYDREGESIAWHLKEALRITNTKYKRVIFTEITKTAIIKAIENPCEIDMNMFYAQQARRIVDRLLGYKISPILWKQLTSNFTKGKSLSAGRVQSVVNHLLQLREQEIKNFESKSQYIVNASFECINNTKNIIDAKGTKPLVSKEETMEELERCKTKKFQVLSVKKSTRELKARPPFITSTLQQEASIRFHMSPKETMAIAQKLYETGHITYMRTDSVVLSKEAMGAIKNLIVSKYGKEYYKPKQFANKSKNAQEAHEAIRPTRINIENLNEYASLTQREKNLYKLIWQRTIASQMPSCFMDCIKLTIGQSKTDNLLFEAYAEKVKTMGFRSIYIQAKEEEEESHKNKYDTILNQVPLKTKLNYKTIEANEKYTRHKDGRYTEANLVKTLDKLGIGRPSTFSSMVSIVQMREYARKGNIPGKNKNITCLRLIKQNEAIQETTTEKKVGEEKNKILPTGLGKTVDGYLTNEFPMLLDFSFTSSLEDLLDDISKGNKEWASVVKFVYDKFSPKILELEKACASITSSSKQTMRKNERILGADSNGRTLIACIGKYGPMIVSKKEDTKDMYAPLKTQTIEEVTLEEATELFRYPKELGQYKNKPVCLMKGQYGLYAKYNNKNISFYGELKEKKEEEITLEMITKCIQEKEKQMEKERIVDNDIVIKCGQYGYYIQYKKKTNVSLPSYYDPKTITKDQCLSCIQNKKKRTTTKKET